MFAEPVGVVTGASGGIGSHLVSSLRGKGFRVLAVGRDPDRLLDVAGASRSVVWDASVDPESVPAELASLDRVDVLVHNAAVAPISRISDEDPGALTAVLAVNLIAASTLTRALLPALRTARGHVIFVNSSAGLNGVPGWSAYLASKAALHQFADALRSEERSNGIRVTTAFPGAVATDLLRKVREGFGRAYDPDQCVSAAAAAGLITSVLDHPDDGYLTEISFAR